MRVGVEVGVEMGFGFGFGLGLGSGMGLGLGLGLRLGWRLAEPKQGRCLPSVMGLYRATSWYLGSTGTPVEGRLSLWYEEMV